MNLTQIKHVLEINQKGSLSLAAASLCISQPALSKSLKQLEDELNNQIFERTRTGMRLTSFGRTFVENATTAKNSLETIEKIARNISTDNKSFRVSASSLRVVGYAFKDLFDKYHQSAHTLKYHQTNITNTFNDVDKFESDIGVIMLPYPYVNDCIPIFANARIQYEPIVKYQPRLCVSPKSPLFNYNGTTIDYKDVHGNEIYFGYEQHPSFKTAKIKMKDALHMDNIYFYELGGESYHMGWLDIEEVVCTANIHNLYEKLGSTEFIDLVAQNKMKILDIENAPCCFEFAYIYRKDVPLTYISREFMDICRSYLLSEVNAGSIIK